MSSLSVTVARLWKKLSSPAAGEGTALLGDSDAGAYFTGTTQAAINQEIGLKLFPIYAPTVSSGANGATNGAAIQASIDACSAAGGGTVVLKSNTGTITSTPLVPKPGVTVDLQYNTLKLADSQSGPLIYDGRSTGTVYERFGVVNGTLDCNRATNNTSNLTGGAIWLTHWDRLYFAGLKITGGYRNLFNLYGCQIVRLDDILCLDNGINGDARFAYGADFETSSPAARPCKSVKVSNFTVTTMWGFGIHFNGVQGFEAENLFFTDLAFTSNQAIAITCTQASAGTIRNAISSNVNGDTYEFNACTDIDCVNLITDTPGRYGLLFGDNATGLYNQRVRINGFTCTNTGHATFSMTLNWMKGCSISDFTVDKALNTLTTGGPATDRNNLLADGVFAGAANALATRYRKFNMERVRFSNFFVARGDGPLWTVTCPQVSDQFEVAIPNGSAAYVELDDLFDSTLNFRSHISGKLRTDTFLPGVPATQSSYQEVLFVASNNGSTINLGTVTTVSNSVARALTITADAANKRLVLTNATGSDVTATWAIDLVGV